MSFMHFMQIGYRVASCVLLLAGSLFAIALPSAAATIDVEFRSDGALVATLDESQLGATCTAGTPLENCVVSGLAVGDFDVDLDMLISATGINSAGLSVQNLGADTERLTVDIILTTGTVTGATAGGNIGGSVTDGISGAGDGTATMSTVLGSALYSALVDGSSFQTMHADPFSVTATGSGSTSVTADSFGLPGLTEPVPGGVASTIRLRYDFTLTAEDTASLNGNFIVVPEPGTALLLAIGLIALANPRRPDRRR
jgi:hypothetical protein